MSIDISAEEIEHRAQDCQRLTEVSALPWQPYLQDPSSAAHEQNIIFYASPVARLGILQRSDIEYGLLRAARQDGICILSDAQYETDLRILSLGFDTEDDRVERVVTDILLNTKTVRQDEFFDKLTRGRHLIDAFGKVAQSPKTPGLKEAFAQHQEPNIDYQAMMSNVSKVVLPALKNMQQS